MEYKSELIADIAILDIDLALKGLISLNEDGPPEDSSTEEVMEWAHFLCTYSRFLHLNTWTDRESIKRVEKEFLPEFDKAISHIDTLLEQPERFGFDTDNCTKLNLYSAHISARSANLKKNYCSSLGTAFDPGTEYPPEL
jgi:hypothetical protein